MSSSGDGDKPAQTGLVDMGDISSFSELVLNVTWAQLQGTEGGALTTSAIDSAIAQVNAYNAANGTNLGIKLRVWGGYTAPDWAKNIDGPPVTITGQSLVVRQVYADQTIGRFWTADYVDAWSSFQAQLAAIYDSNPIIRGISQTAGAAASDRALARMNSVVIAPAGGVSGTSVSRAVVVGWRTAELAGG